MVAVELGRDPAARSHRVKGSSSSLHSWSSRALLEQLEFFKVFEWCMAYQMPCHCLEKKDRRWLELELGLRV